MKSYLTLSILLCTLLITPLWAAEDNVMLGEFSNGAIDGWEEKSFVDHTRYEVTTIDGRTALRAHSKQNASGLFRELKVDLTKTPVLNWSWRVDNIFNGNDERAKEGDDYPARVYVVFSGGVWFWKSRALNFVWSSHQAVDSSWPNAFTEHARMVAIETGTEYLGQWRAYKVDVRALYKQYFGEDIDEVDAVAIMTDTDNAGGEAVAYYGDIFFSED